MSEHNLARAVSKLVEDCSAINPSIHFDRLKAICEIWLEKLERRKATATEVEAIGLILTDMRTFPLPADVMDALSAVRSGRSRQLRTYHVDGELVAMDPVEAANAGLEESNTMFEMEPAGADGLELLERIRKGATNG